MCRDETSVCQECGTMVLMVSMEIVGRIQSTSRSHGTLFRIENDMTAIYRPSNANLLQLHVLLIIVSRSLEMNYRTACNVLRIGIQQKAGNNSGNNKGCKKYSHFSLSSYCACLLHIVFSESSRCPREVGKVCLERSPPDNPYE